MDTWKKSAVIGAAVPTIIIAIVYGPLVAAFVVAGVGCALMVTLMAFVAVHSIAAWRLDHPDVFHRHTRV
jgi:hypothetical protein